MLPSTLSIDESYLIEHDNLWLILGKDDEGIYDANKV